MITQHQSRYIGRWKPVLVQLAVLIVLTLVVASGVRMVMQKVGAQQTASGFGFLSNTAGFEISESVISYDSSMSYGRVIFAGIVNTLVCALIAGVLATVIGLAVGLARLSQNFLLRNLTLAISECIRNVPLLLQLMFWYGLVLNAFPNAIDVRSVLDVLITNRGIFFPWPADANGRLLLGMIPVCCFVLIWVYRRLGRVENFRIGQGRKYLRGAVAAVFLLLAAAAYWHIDLSTPALQGFNIAGGTSISPEMTALVLGLTVYSAAAIGEVIRSGVLSVPRGQQEAAFAIGLRPFDRMRHVILPQALRLILPPASNVYLSLVKSTSLGVAVGFPDLTSVIGTAINQSGHAIEGVLIQIVVYLAISFAIWTAVDIYDRRTKYVLR